MKARQFTFLLPLCLAATPLLAQDGMSSSASKNLSKKDAEIVEDIGDIKEAEVKPIKWRTSIGAHADYTSNAKLTGNNSSSDVLFFPTLQGGFNAELGKGFTFDLDVKIESALYSRYNERSFAGYSAAATLDWRPKPNLPRIYIGAEPYRYDSFDTGDLMTQAIGASAGTDWGFAFNHGNSLAYFGYTFTKYYTDPGIDNRSANKFIAGITHQLRGQLYGQILYRFMYSEFDDISRNDAHHLVGVNFIYQVNRHLFGSLGGTFIDNNSTQTRASYQSLGASLGVNWQF